MQRPDHRLPGGVINRIDSPAASVPSMPTEPGHLKQTPLLSGREPQRGVPRCHHDRHCLLSRIWPAHGKRHNLSTHTSGIG